MFKRTVLALAALTAALAAPMAAHAQDSGSWIVRARALHLDPANDDSAGIGVGVDSKTFPEVDISYFFTPNLAAELILTYPQKHDVDVNGTKIGSVKHLPPTLSLQYHFTNFSGFRPYAGVGVNYTRFSSVDLPAGYDIDRNSWGWALGAGVDVPLGGGWLFNVDVKKVQIDTDISVNGTKATNFEIDPLLFSIGIGKRF